MFASSLSLYVLKIQILYRRKEALCGYSDDDDVTFIARRDHEKYHTGIINQSQNIS